MTAEENGRYVRKDGIGKSLPPVRLPWVAS